MAVEMAKGRRRTNAIVVVSIAGFEEDCRREV